MKDKDNSVTSGPAGASPGLDVSPGGRRPERAPGQGCGSRTGPTKAPPKVHELKTLPVFFQATAMGLKPFEVRRNDRGFAVGDVLELREWLAARSCYTGAKLRRRVSFILAGGQFGLEPGYVALGLEVIPEVIDESKKLDEWLSKRGYGAATMHGYPEPWERDE